MLQVRVQDISMHLAEGMVLLQSNLLQCLLIAALSLLLPSPLLCRVHVHTHSWFPFLLPLFILPLPLINSVDINTLRAFILVLSPFTGLSVVKLSLRKSVVIYDVSGQIAVGHSALLTFSCSSSEYDLPKMGVVPTRLV